MRTQVCPLFRTAFHARFFFVLALMSNSCRDLWSGLAHRWLVRLFDGSDNQKEAWVPVSILDTKQVDAAIYGDKADDAAYRRE